MKKIEKKKMKKKEALQITVAYQVDYFEMKIIISVLIINLHLQLFFCLCNGNTMSLIS